MAIKTNPMSRGIDESLIDHDALLNWIANKHINHSEISINAGSGLTGGGDLTTNRTLELDINGLIADGSPVGATDYVVTYDVDAATHKKVLLDDLPSGGGGVTDHGALTGLGDDDHTQYLLVDGSRDFTGSVNLNSFAIEYKINGNRALAMPVDNTNIAIGTESGESLTTGNNNVSIGYRTLAKVVQVEGNKISREEVASIVNKTALYAQSNRALEEDYLEIRGRCFIAGGAL